MAYKYVIEFKIETVDTVEVEADTEKLAIRKAIKTWKDRAKLEVVKLIRE